MFALRWWKGCEHIINNRSLELEGILYIYFLLCFIFALSALWAICHKQQKKRWFVLLAWVAIPFFTVSSQAMDWTHCRWIIYQLSNQGSPRLLEWVAYPFSTRSSKPRNRTRVSCIASGFFTSWATKEAPHPTQPPFCKDPLFFHQTDTGKLGSQINPPVCSLSV